MLSFLSALLFAASVSAPTLTLEIQRTPIELARGLQGHAPLAENEGMLFIFPEPKVAHFWMKDVTFPIDIVFLDDQRRVLNVAVKAPPCRSVPCVTFDSIGRASYVLELRAGWSLRYGVKPGSRFELDIPNQKARLRPGDRVPK